MKIMKPMFMKKKMEKSPKDTLVKKFKA